MSPQGVGGGSWGPDAGLYRCAGALFSDVWLENLVDENEPAEASMSTCVSSPSHACLRGMGKQQAAQTLSSVPLSQETTSSAHGAQEAT